MTVQDLEAALKKILPEVAYKEFEEPPTAPYIAWHIPLERQYGGDEENLILFQSVVVELYSHRKQFEMERQIEAVLAGVAFEKEEDRLESDALILVSYSFDLYNEREVF